ncbi:MAG: right-handed parallel beta-helix repeat-containing protein, partial [Bacteroidetes bacterium]|nr:right-handed parallel beta-helix repeat-containing protein [Bacteroidota bacterium]
SADATSAALASAADWLVARQDVSGGFPWSLGDATLYGNVQGPPGRGVLKAYQYTGNTAYRTAAVNNGNFLVPNYPRVFTDGDARFATYDPLFLEELSASTGMAGYASFVQTQFWDKLTSGTYGESNNLNAAGFCDLVITGRSGIVELVPWDIGGVAVGAHVAGEDAIKTAVMSKVVEALNLTTTDTDTYDVIGLAGAVWASAVTGIGLDPTAGIYAADNSTADLAARLAALQQTNGAWMWSAQNPECVATDPTNFDTQVTAFAVLALKTFDAATYHDQIYKGAGFLLSMQQSDGQMLIYPVAAPTADGGVETHAEALMAIVTVRPDDIFVDDSWASATPGQEVAAGKFFGFNAFATLQDGVDASLSGHTVSMAEGTYPLAGNVTLNKANLTVQGAGSTLTVLQVSGTGNRLSVMAEGITIQDLQIRKTDDASPQDIIYVGADNFTLKDNVISGQYVMGDPEVSRAMVVTYGITGLHIEGNTIHHLRQPAYINGSLAAPTTGPILNNSVYATKGWVIDGANMTFTGNTWGDGTLAQQNWKDIAILVATDGSYYPDILAVGQANNNAMVEDQRVTPRQNTIVYVAPGGTSDGSPHGPMGTFAAAVAGTVAGGTIYASAGTYNESVTLTKRVTLDGAGSGSDPATNTVIVGSGVGTGITTVAGASAVQRTVIKDVFLTSFPTGIYASSYLSLENVTADGQGGTNVRGLELPSLENLSINGCKFNGYSIGMRSGTATNISNVTIGNSEFNNNVQGWFIAGAPSVGSASFSNVQVTNCTFNNNLQKGLYIEKLSDAVFDGITVLNSGTDPTYGFNNGIDINLTDGTYQNIQIRNSTITGSGATGSATNPYNPAAVTIKARDDAPNYNSKPATLTNVTIDNCVIEGPQNALRFGEFDKVNASPTAVVIKNSTLTGSGADKYHLVNNTTADILATEGNTFTGSTTLAQIEAKIRHGLDDPALGVVNYGQFVPSSEVWVNTAWAGASPGDPVDGHWFGTDAFATIQAGINAVLVPGTVNVAAGTYTEAVTLNKSQITLRGAASGGAIINPANTALNALTLAGNQFVISRLTLTGGKNGLYGTTANSRMLSLVVTGNAENGIQLVDADNNLVQASTVSSHPAGAGIRLTGSRQNTVSGNTVQTSNYNVLVEINGARNAIGNIIQGNTLVSPGTWGVLVTNEPQTTAVNFNVFGPPTSGKYIRNASTTVSLDAQFNWFGGETTFGAGDFEGLVNTNGAYATDPTVAIFPVTHFMPQNSTVNISVMALIPSGTTVKGTDINLSWDNDGAIPDDGIPLEGPFFAAAGNTFFEFTNPTTSSLRVNQSLLSTGGVTGGSIPYVNVLFTQAFKSGTADGVNHILLNAVQMRDPENAPITVNLDPDPTPQATLIVDGTPPSIAVAIDNQTSLWTDAWLKNGDQIAVTATITDAYPLTAADITANLGGLFGGIDHTADHPAGYAAPLASWPVVASASCNPANGTITVTVTATDALGNVGTASATITADNTPPNSLTNFKANAG